MSTTAAATVIERFGLRAHPEGGWYAETWRADAATASGRPRARSSTCSRPASDPTGTASMRRRSGSTRPATRSSCASGRGDGTAVVTHRLGPGTSAGEAPQVVVPAGAWQAARPLGAWTLVGCIVSPAFEFAGFELAPEGWEPPAAGGVTTGRRVSARELNRATLQRQWLLERHRATPSEAVGALAGLQAQHANWPYIALWSRVRDLAIADLEGALKDRSVVKGTLMRSTLHLVAADDYFAFDAAVVESRTAVLASIAQRAGLDLEALHEELLAFCDRAADRGRDGGAPGQDRAGFDDRGSTCRRSVRHAAFRMASAGGGLVHVPPSGLWRSHGKPAYIDARVWLKASTVARSRRRRCSGPWNGTWPGTDRPRWPTSGSGSGNRGSRTCAARSTRWATGSCR